MSCKAMIILCFNGKRYLCKEIANNLLNTQTFLLTNSRVTASCNP